MKCKDWCTHLCSSSPAVPVTSWPSLGDSSCTCPFPCQVDRDRWSPAIKIREKSFDCFGGGGGASDGVDRPATSSKLRDQNVPKK